MAKKKAHEKWKKLTPEEERKIIKDHNKGRVRNGTLREYGITSDQYCCIIRSAILKTNVKWKGDPG